MSDKIAVTRAPITAMIVTVAAVCAQVVVVSARPPDDWPNDADEERTDYSYIGRESRMKTQVQAYNIVGLLYPFDKYRKTIATIAIVCVAVVLTVTYICYFCVLKPGCNNCATCKCHRYRRNCTKEFR